MIKFSLKIANQAMNNHPTGPKNSSQEMIKNLGKEEKLTVTQKFLQESLQAVGHSATIKNCHKK